jgi:SAM-dependent methyltransferase
MSSTYRWNQSQFAAGYDAAAAHIHPHYHALQQQILDLLPFSREAEVLLVDAGGGSGRLAALFLERFPHARALVVDQSEPFLKLAEQRLQTFEGRGQTHLARLQDDWPSKLTEPPAAIVSMSAIHHLDPGEKQQLYRQMHDALAHGGVLLNGDEVRHESDDEYLASLRQWSAHMQAKQDTGEIPPQMAEILDAWREKNIARFGTAKKSGDDCHETIAVQLDYLRAAGFATADVPWQREMWAILRGGKS